MLSILLDKSFGSGFCCLDLEQFRRLGGTFSYAIRILCSADPICFLFCLIRVSALDFGACTLNSSDILDAIYYRLFLISPSGPCLYRNRKIIAPSLMTCDHCGCDMILSHSLYSRRVHNRISQSGVLGVTPDSSSFGIVVCNMCPPILLRHIYMGFLLRWPYFLVIYIWLLLLHLLLSVHFLHFLHIYCSSWLLLLHLLLSVDSVCSYSSSTGSSCSDTPSIWLLLLWHSSDICGSSGLVLSSWLLLLLLAPICSISSS